MNLKRLIVLSAIGLFTFGASAGQIIIPAAGAGRGAAGSNWQSDVVLHNTAPRDITVAMSLHIGTQVIGPRELPLKAKNTIVMQDILKSVFGVNSGTGALVFELADRDVKYLAVNSRTYNLVDQGEYGQGIPSFKDSEAAKAGDIAVLNNTGIMASLFRFNFGIYAVENTTVRWELLRTDGAVVATKEVSYAAGEHQQYNNGVISRDFFFIEPKFGDSVYARILTGRAVVYGSSVNSTGDPTFVESNITREDVMVNFGIDLDENGTIDIADADNDGVLDAPVTVYTSLYPAYFRIVAESEFGDPVQLEVVSSEADAVFRDANGTMRVGAAGDLKNKSGSIVIRATTNGTVATFTIPVRFK